MINKDDLARHNEHGKLTFSSFFWVFIKSMYKYTYFYKYLNIIDNKKD